ncbi:14461_t:CDS:2, partial [Dentiscutata heterogama]
ISQFSEILLDSTNHINSHPHQLIFGWSESEWWDVNLFDWHINDGDINLKLQAGGFNLDVLKAARNPGFYDPWSPTRDITLANKNYFGLYSAKLDWTLLCGFEVINRWIGNDDYSASDHKYMMVEIKFDGLDKISNSSTKNSWKLKRDNWKKELHGTENVNLGKWVKILGIGISVSIFIFNTFHRR